MLSASAYSFRQKSRLAVSLSWIAGFTNVVTFLVCGELVSHATGNVTHLGRTVTERFVGKETGYEILYLGALIVCFLIGALASGWMLEMARRRGWRSKYILPLLAEAALLSIITFVIVRHPRIGFDQTRILLWVTGMGSVAMGLQNATITRISGAVVRTTHLTGVVTDIGLESMQLMFWWWEKWRAKRWRRLGRMMKASRRLHSAEQLGLHLRIFGSFIVGACLGTVLWYHLSGLALLAPILFLFAVVMIDLFKPIAEVRELNLMADDELKALGLVQSELPSQIGVYRMASLQGNREHRAPDLQTWVDRLPKRWRVTILAMSPLMRIDEESVEDLKAVATRLRRQGRMLVISGVTVKQYREMDRLGVLRAIGRGNVFPDLEFAIARGIDLLEHPDHA